MDRYANQGYVTVVPVLNTLSFNELATFVSIFEKKAFLINRVEYSFTLAALNEFDTEADFVTFGLSTSNIFPVAGLNVAAIFDYNMLSLNLAAAGVSSHLISSPFVKDFSTLPGGGTLVPARPIFIWMLSGGFAAAGECAARIFFTVIDLKADEYWELVEATRLLGV